METKIGIAKDTSTYKIFSKTPPQYNRHVSALTDYVPIINFQLNEAVFMQISYHTSHFTGNSTLGRTFVGLSS